MHFSSIILAGIIAAASPESGIISKVPNDWYTSTTKLFDYCVEVKFEHPICPQITRGNFTAVDFNSEFFKPPVGDLTPKTLFQATVLYQVNRPPNYWFVGLKLDEEKPETIPARLWAEAQWLWSRILFDQRKYDESLKFFDKLVDEFKGRALFHQQRAWAQFFTGQFDKALGSVVSAESPLIYPVPFFEKFFLRALIEKENCHYRSAVDTITAGRASLKYSQSDSDKHPWVVLCNERNLGATCSRLRSWYGRVYQSKVEGSLKDLDLLEIELRDRLTEGQEKKSSSSIVWPFVGENWKDELGYYSVPIERRC